MTLVSLSRIVGACTLALALPAGCGSGSGSATSWPSPAGDPRAFAQCVREHGVAVPDPDPDGKIDMDAAEEQVGRQALEEALAACQKFAGTRTGQRQEGSEALDQMVAYAQCMRENGVDMPDPVVENGDARWPAPANVSRDSAEYAAANEVCKRHLPGAGAGRQK
jgi:hypothetical protein